MFAQSCHPSKAHPDMPYCKGSSHPGANCFTFVPLLGITHTTHISSCFVLITGPQVQGCHWSGALPTVWGWSVHTGFHRLFFWGHWWAEGSDCSSSFPPMHEFPGTKSVLGYQAGDGHQATLFLEMVAWWKVADVITRGKTDARNKFPSVEIKPKSTIQFISPLLSLSKWNFEITTRLPLWITLQCRCIMFGQIEQKYVFTWIIGTQTPASPPTCLSTHRITSMCLDRYSYRPRLIL